MDKKYDCDCGKCELTIVCPYIDKYQRLPRDTCHGALGLCPKLPGNEKIYQRMLQKIKNQPADAGTSTD